MLNTIHEREIFHWLIYFRMEAMPPEEKQMTDDEIFKAIGAGNG